MILYRFFVAIFVFLIFSNSIDARLPSISPKDAKDKIQEIMKMHASHKSLTPEITKRALKNYLEILDPTKTYFIKSDIQNWLNPTDELIQDIMHGYSHASFHEFERMNLKFQQVVERRAGLEKQIDTQNLPKNIRIDEFKEMDWVNDPEQLLDRLVKIKSLQYEGILKLPEEIRERSLQRIAKRQAKMEEDLLTKDQVKKEQYMLTNIVKATSSALDSQTAYFTPDEAKQFKINVQQRLYGIGAQLRDDINGFTVVKLVEGGPAFYSKELKVKDRIIAVNGEPVVGMDIENAVELIRGEAGTPVVLTVIRATDNGNEEKIDVVLKREEVVLKESRFDIAYEPFGDGVIAYLRLHSFYQDFESSSSEDLEKAFNQLNQEHPIKGVIFDLRYNSGGMLSQAVMVTGLFIKKGVVVSIKDDAGAIQRLRALNEKAMWNGPLIVLINRASASASEIVAQTLQDYGRALIIGDDHTYGKGSFQTFTLNVVNNQPVNPKGEYKVTRGRYYTVSGKTPQLTGVLSDIVVPGPLIESEIGEKFSKYPLENDRISSSFDDDLSDIPLFQREKLRRLYRFGLQKKQDLYGFYLDVLKNNSDVRVQNNANYQNFLKELKKDDIIDDENFEHFGQTDLQLRETYNIMKDLILLKTGNIQ